MLHQINLKLVYLNSVLLVLRMEIQQLAVLLGVLEKLACTVSTQVYR
jgi:hypothetical protein